MSGAVIVSQKRAMYIRARMCVYIYIYKEVVKKKKKEPTNLLSQKKVPPFQMKYLLNMYAYVLIHAKS